MLSTMGYITFGVVFGAVLGFVDARLRGLW